jgi:hypothetical protein
MMVSDHDSELIKRQESVQSVEVLKSNIEALRMSIAELRQGQGENLKRIEDIHKMLVAYFKDKNGALLLEPKNIQQASR